MGLGLGADLVMLGDEHRLADAELTSAFGDVARTVGPACGLALFAGALSGLAAGSPGPLPGFSAAPCVTHA